MTCSVPWEWSTSVGFISITKIKFHSESCLHSIMPTLKEMIYSSNNSAYNSRYRSGDEATLNDLINTSI